jgi:urease subunit alpha
VLRAHAGRPTLVHFWGVTCGPCKVELPLLGQFMKENGAIDMVIVNALVIDAVAGIVKGDIGIKAGKIVAIGKAGNPHIMAGVDPRLIVGPNTQVLIGEGMIATVGGFDVHVHFVGTDQCAHALASGITTMLGGALGPAFAVDCGGPWTTEQMLRAAEGFAMNFGFFARGSSHKPEAIVEQLAGGVIGVKIHEDFGAMPATIDASRSQLEAEHHRRDCSTTECYRAHNPPA